MKQLPLLIGLMATLTLPAGAQKNVQVHNTVTLPPAAHKNGQAAGFFVDPITGYKVYRLSDGNLCPRGATHTYSYTNQFSPKGRMVFDCMQGQGAPTIYPIYGPDFRLETDDALAAAHVPGRGTTLKEIQWSQEREVLYAITAGGVVELDPIAHKTRGVVNFIARFSGFARPNGKKLLISGLNSLSVGPGDRLMVHLLCNFSSPGCPEDGAVVGIGVFDPATGQAHAMFVPVPGDHAPKGFDEGEWTQNPKGRMVLVYEDAPNFSYSADLASRVKFDDNHGHRGFFCGSNGRCYMVRPKNDNLPNGGVGGIGCRKPNGELDLPWKTEAGIYDDETGKRVLVWGCDLGGQNPFEHFARSPGAKDVFGVATERYTYEPSMEKFYATDEAILRAVVEYAGGEPVRVQMTPVAYHRSGSSTRAKWLGRQCDYWAYPRMVMDFSGTRFLFDSTMSHPEWPALEGRKPKSDCRTDVYVAEWAAKP